MTRGIIVNCESLFLVSHSFTELMQRIFNRDKIQHAKLVRWCNMADGSYSIGTSIKTRTTNARGGFKWQCNAITISSYKVKDCIERKK